MNAKNKYGHTALMWASTTDNLEIIKSLLEAGANVNAEDKDGSTAIAWASYFNNEEIIKILLKKEQDIQKNIF